MMLDRDSRGGATTPSTLVTGSRAGAAAAATTLVIGSRAGLPESPR